MTSVSFFLLHIHPEHTRVSLCFKLYDFQGSRSQVDTKQKGLEAGSGKKVVHAMMPRKMEKAMDDELQDGDRDQSRSSQGDHDLP